VAVAAGVVTAVSVDQEVSSVSGVVVKEFERPRTGCAFVIFHRTPNEFAADVAVVHRPGSRDMILRQGI
jgi:hypothetical protein